MRSKIIPALLLTITHALAHVTLVEPGALPGAHYLARFRVGHGCSGSPTIALRVAIPKSIRDVRPQPVPGWTMDTEQAGDGSTAITWRGGSLAANQPGEFAVAMTLPSAEGVLVFPATQTCQAGSEQWSDLPATDGASLKHPAPILTVSPHPAKMPGDPMAGMKM